VTESATPPQYLPLGLIEANQPHTIALIRNTETEQLIGVLLPPGLQRPASGHAYRIDPDHADGPQLIVDWDREATTTDGLHPPVDGAHRYVAAKHVQIGDAWLAPGDPVPDEPGRDYGAMLANGEIRLSEAGVAAVRTLDGSGAVAEGLK
jgi:hypothetical protein